ncbi:hypothetical protein [Actinomycetospora straminea]|uniref:Uncharacterized protein n=1 Tax=Actinomycetospora straminea TaxID=663607 RepID=A0ABP9EAN4_9PSEU|nr:hypothetical protein [Actinomycetospora straminea]MDD7932035.1 hypothetical protein [Actinomycetospora straminea]
MTDHPLFPSPNGSDPVRRARLLVVLAIVLEVAAVLTVVTIVIGSPSTGHLVGAVLGLAAVSALMSLAFINLARARMFAGMTGLARSAVAGGPYGHRDGGPGGFAGGPRGSAGGYGAPGRGGGSGGPGPWYDPSGWPGHDHHQPWHHGHHHGHHDHGGWSGGSDSGWSGSSWSDAGSSSSDSGSSSSDSGSSSSSSDSGSSSSSDSGSSSSSSSD